MGTTAVDGLVFDLDNTLFDRQAAFIRVAEEFYDEQLRATASMTRDDAVAMMVRWDGDGYASREAMFARWLDEWPEAGLDMGSLTSWFRSAMERQAQPDMEVNGPERPLLPGNHALPVASRSDGLNWWSWLT